MSIKPFASYHLTWSCALTISLLVNMSNVQAEMTHAFGLTPQHTQQQSHLIWQPIIKEINKEREIKLRIITKKNIAEFESALFTGKFDIAYISTLQLIKANVTQGYRPLIRDISRPFHTGTHVPFDKKYTEIQIDEPTTIPEDNPLSASILLRPEPDDDFNLLIYPFYFSSKNFIEDNISHNKNSTRDTSQKITLHRNKISTYLIVVHPRINEATSKYMQDIFISLNNDAKSRKLLLKIPIETVGKPSILEYSSLLQKNNKKLSSQLK